MKVFGFFKDVYGELQRVVWPTRAETIRNTVVVVVFCAAAAIILGAADIGLTRLFDFVLSR